MYKYLLFDADNTLFDFTKASAVAFSETLSNFKIDQKEETYSIYLEINHACWARLEKGEITPKEIKTLRFQLFLEAVREKGNPLEVNDFYLNRLGEKDYLLDGAKDLLLDLKSQNYSLSIITNGLQLVQRPRIEKAGLTHLFDAITVSEEIGIAKPKAAFFDDTFRQLGQPKIDDVLVIGDNLTSDILGGINIGADTAWFNAKKKMNETEIVPTYEVKGFEELKKIIV
jgi:2-haloacid dehalogenase